MPVLARRQAPPEEAPAPVRRPRLRLAPPPARGLRGPRPRTVAAYALGLTIGFLLAGVASAPGGSGIVAAQLALAGVAAVVGALAALRARAVERREAARQVRAERA